MLKNLCLVLPVLRSPLWLTLGSCDLLEKAREMYSARDSVGISLGLTF